MRESVVVFVFVVAFWPFEYVPSFTHMSVLSHSFDARARNFRYPHWSLVVSPMSPARNLFTQRDFRFDTCKKNKKNNQGQERYHALGPIYYRDANGALLVYDITDRDSFTKVRNWVKELKKMMGNDIVLCICGNKIDLEKKRQVNKEEALAYAESVGAVHCLASAKSGRGVEAAFLELTKGLLKKTQAQPAGRGGRGKRRQGVGVAITDEPPRSKGCCSN